MRDFKGIWIPSDIWLDERLNALEKAILMEIDSLDVDGCYASNEYLADFCKCSERKITEAISKLIELGYISLKNFDGRTRILISNLAKNSILPRKNCEAASQKMKANNNNRDNIKDKENTSKDIKEKFGTYGRVKLSHTEYKKLVDDHGKDYIDDLINKLDEYVESNNNKNKYTNFNLVIRKAIREKWFIDKEEKKEKKFERKSEWGKEFKESFKQEQESTGSKWLDDFLKKCDEKEQD